MMWRTDGLGWGGWVVMTLVMVIFWGLVIFAIGAIFRGSGNDRSESTSRLEHDPARILEMRFEREEIDADEYHARQDVLRTSTDRCETRVPVRNDDHPFL